MSEKLAAVSSSRIECRMSTKTPRPPAPPVVADEAADALAAAVAVVVAVAVAVAVTGSAGFEVCWNEGLAMNNEIRKGTHARL